jgi:hypothetical protein
MKKFLTLTAVAALFSVGVAADANAWTRDGWAYGWRGVSHFHATGSCANGTCSRQATAAGPYGRTVSRQGSVSCAGGVCTGSRTTTGPRGGTVTRQATVSR